MLSDAYDGDDDEAGGKRRGKMERVTEREGRGKKGERKIGLLGEETEREIGRFGGICFERRSWRRYIQYVFSQLGEAIFE